MKGDFSWFTFDPVGEGTLAGRFSGTTGGSGLAARQGRRGGSVPRNRAAAAGVPGA